MPKLKSLGIEFELSGLLEEAWSLSPYLIKLLSNSKLEKIDLRLTSVSYPDLEKILLNIEGNTKLRYLRLKIALELDTKLFRILSNIITRN